MIEGLRRPPLQVNETAPDFTLPLVNGDGTVSLSDYRGKRAVLLAIFRGLNCAFCRRHIVQLGSFQPKLLDAGVEVLAITGSPLQRARLYLRYRPIKVPLAADADRVTHRLYRLPRGAVTPELEEWLRTRYRGLAREQGVVLPETVSYTEVVETVARLDNFEMTEEDWKRQRGEGPTAQFLVDTAGIVRWTNIEGPTEETGLAGFPNDDQLLAAARQL
ncbi:MAG TPA: redoxin domain-containing protein [Methylomirabilota bacterium]